MLQSNYFFFILLSKIVTLVVRYCFDILLTGAATAWTLSGVHSFIVFIVPRSVIYVHAYYCLFKSSYSSPSFGGKSCKEGGAYFPPSSSIVSSVLHEVLHVASLAKVWVFKVIQVLSTERELVLV